MRRPRFVDQGRAERWKREDEAPRLRELFPDLVALQLQTRERQHADSKGGVSCTRPIAVGSAGALFEVRCGNPKCDNPGHDITSWVIGALRRGETNFDGDDPCSGLVGQHECTRVLHFVVSATWRKADTLVAD